MDKQIAGSCPHSIIIPIKKASPFPIGLAAFFNKGLDWALIMQ